MRGLLGFLVHLQIMAPPTVLTQSISHYFSLTTYGFSFVPGSCCYNGSTNNNTLLRRWSFWYTHIEFD